MSEHDNVDLACDLITAWNARDLRRYRALLSDDCVVEGRLDEISDTWFEVTDVAANEHTAVVSWRARGTVWRDGSDGGSSRTPLDVGGFTVVGLRQRKIVRLWHYWDDEDDPRRRRNDACATTAATATSGNTVTRGDAPAWRTAPTSAPSP